MLLDEELWVGEWLGVDYSSNLIMFLLLTVLYEGGGVVLLVPCLGLFSEVSDLSRSFACFVLNLFRSQTPLNIDSTFLYITCMFSQL